MSLNITIINEFNTYHINFPNINNSALYSFSTERTSDLPNDILNIVVKNEELLIEKTIVPIGDWVGDEEIDERTVSNFLQIFIKTDSITKQLFSLKTPSHSCITDVLHLIEKDLDFKFNAGVLKIFENIMLEDTKLIKNPQNKENGTESEISLQTFPLLDYSDKSVFYKEEESQNQADRCSYNSCVVFNQFIEVYDILKCKSYKIRYWEDANLIQFTDILKKEAHIYTPSFPLLLYNGSYLVENKSLHEYGIRQDSIVYFVVVSYSFSMSVMIDSIEIESFSNQELNDLINNVRINRNKQYLNTITITWEINRYINAGILFSEPNEYTFRELTDIYIYDNKEENMIEGTISKEIIKDVQTLNMLSTISLPFDILEIAGVEHICACTHHGYFPNLKSITVDLQNTNITVQKIISNVLSYLDVSIEIKINGEILRHEISNLVLENVYSQNELIETQKNLQREIVKNQSIEAQYSELTKEYANIERELIEINKNCEQKDDQIKFDSDMMQVNNDSCISSLYEVKANLAIANNTIIKLQDENESLRNDILNKDILVSKMDERINTLIDENSQLATENAKYELDMQLNPKTEAATETTNTEEQRLSWFGGKSKNDTLKAAKEKCGQLSSENEELKKENRKLDQRWSLLMSNYESLKKQAQEKETAIQQYIQEIKEQESRIEEYDTRCKERDYENRRLSQLYNNIYESKSRLEATSSELTARNKVLEKENKSNKSKVQKFTNQISQYEKKIKEYKKELYDVNITMKKMRNENYQTNLKYNDALKGKNDQENDLSDQRKQIILLQDAVSKYIYLLKQNNIDYEEVVEDFPDLFIGRDNGEHKESQISKEDEEGYKNTITKLNFDNNKLLKEKEEMRQELNVSLSDNKRLAEEQKEINLKYMTCKEKYQSLYVQYMKIMKGDSLDLNPISSDLDSDIQEDHPRSRNTLQCDFTIFNSKIAMDFLNTNQLTFDKSFISVMSNFLKQNCQIYNVTDIIMKGIKFSSVTEKNYVCLKSILLNNVFPMLWLLDIRNCTIYPDVLLDLLKVFGTGKAPSHVILAISGKYDDPDLLSKIFSIQKEKPSICIANPYLYYLFLPQDIGLKLLNINSEVTFPKVKELDLSNYYVDDYTCLVLSTLLYYEDFSSLKSLILSNNEITDQGLFYLYRALEHKKMKPTKLTKLDLYNNNIQDIGLKILIRAFENNTLGSMERLYIGKNHITTRGFSLLTDSIVNSGRAAYQHIKELEFSNNSISVQAIHYFFQCLYHPDVLKTMTKLCIWGDQIGSEGCSLLFNSINSGAIPNIEEIYLCDADVDDTGINTLTDVIQACINNKLKQLSRLRVLCLSYNNITNVGAERLYNCFSNYPLPKLTNVYLNYNSGITEKMKDKLESLNKDNFVISF